MRGSPSSRLRYPPPPPPPRNIPRDRRFLSDFDSDLACCCHRPAARSLLHHHLDIEMVGICTALPHLAFVACVFSSLFLHSDAWTAKHGIRHTYPRQGERSTTRVHVSGPASERDEQQPAPPVKQQQPWWEEERRTQGMPTLSKATQWRMFLTLKVVTCGFNDVFYGAVVLCVVVPVQLALMSY